MKTYLLTLADTIIKFQGRMRLRMKNRQERNAFNAYHYFAELLGYKDLKTIYKMVNQSTSRVKIGMDDIEQICIEAMDSSPIEDFLIEVNEKIELKKEQIRKKYQEELELLG